MASSFPSIAVMSATPEATATVPGSLRPAEDILAPLIFFYGIGNARPEVRFCPSATLPPIERHLLVHDEDMTPRLRSHHGCRIDLEVAAKARIGNYLVRASVLRRSTDAEPVEFGAIGIHLESLPSTAVSQVLEGHIPFGAILENFQIPHSSHPRAWFDIAVDSRLAQLLGAQVGQRLFGRCNELRCSDGSVLADVVEVLPAGEPIAQRA